MLSACALVLLLLLSGCSPRPVVEVVTTDSGRPSAIPAGAQSLAVEPKLPARDPDIEAAGDRIAEALTYLNAHHRDRREIALRALNQSESAINRALRNAMHDEGTRLALRSALRELNNAEHDVQRNSPDALRQLSAISRELDGINSRLGAEEELPGVQGP